MSDLWAIGAPILIADTINPVFLAGVIMGLTTRSPVTTSLVVILGHALSYFATGLLILFGLADLLADLVAPLIRIWQNPAPAHFVVGLVIGLLLMIVAWRWKIAPPDPQAKHPERVDTGLPSAFVFGAFVSLAGMPFALPYFAFLNELYDLNDAQHVIALGVYNLIYVIPFLLMPLAFALMGASILPVLQRLNTWVARTSAYIVPVLLGLLGLALVSDAVVFFVTGQGLL